MNVNLGPVFDEFVSEMLDSGLYQSQSEILREGLRLLKEREEEKRLRLAELRKQIALGGKQADRGQLVNGDQVFAQIRRRSGQRKRPRK
jgi:antitoxin ParD1/3/4